MDKQRLSLWLVALTVLQAIDLITTYIAGISREANLLAALAWAAYGFWLLIVVKVLLLPFFVLVWYLLGKLSHVQGFASPAAVCRVARTLLVIEIMVPLSAVCLWNIYQLT